VPVSVWQPGELIQPGDLRRPTTAGDVSQTALLNPNFEDGDQDWTWAGSGSGTIDEDAPVFDGTWSAKAGITSNPNSTQKTLTNDARIAIVPGQLVTIGAYVRSPGGWGDPGDAPWARLDLVWFNAGGAEIIAESTALLFGYEALNVWVPMDISAVAPSGAATFTARMTFAWGDGGFVIDSFSLDYATQEAQSHNLFKAVQATAGFTGNVEPDWPDMIGNQVVDNEVTWEAVSGNTVTWEANRILVSGSSEPTFPEVINGSVVDNTISWVLDPRRVRDTKVPQSALAAIGASKVFSADDDIAPFSATGNPLDWSTAEDAGFIPFGIQTHGSNPITALGLYRGNLVVSNSVGTQIWQIDPDPALITLLDAIPIGCTFPKSMQPVGNDLVFLASVGIRNMGTVGAAVNLQAGYFGKPIDDLVTAAIEAAALAGFEPHAFYWPAQGQYWLIVGSEAFVLTVSDGGQKGMSWSRYTYPSDIDYVAILDDDLYLRSGDLVWRADEGVYTDDTDLGEGEGGTDTVFQSVLQWPFLDLGSARNKQLVGFDLTGSGNVDVRIGWDQRQPDAAGAPTFWTAAYTVAIDTVVGTIVPMPVNSPSFSLRLAFEAGAAWAFEQATLYVTDQRLGA
jgi:hypothetical protein